MNARQLRLFPTAREARAHERLHAVRVCLVSLGPMTAAQLALVLHVSRQTAARALGSLQTAGEVYPWGYVSAAERASSHGPRARLWAATSQRSRVRLALERLRRILLAAIAVLSRPGLRAKAPDQQKNSDTATTGDKPRHEPAR